MKLLVDQEPVTIDGVAYRVQDGRLLITNPSGRVATAHVVVSEAGVCVGPAGSLLMPFRKVEAKPS